MHIIFVPLLAFTSLACYIIGSKLLILYHVPTSEYIYDAFVASLLFTHRPGLFHNLWQVNGDVLWQAVLPFTA